MLICYRIIERKDQRSKLGISALGIMALGYFGIGHCTCPDKKYQTTVLSFFFWTILSGTVFSVTFFSIYDCFVSGCLFL